MLLFIGSVLAAERVTILHTNDWQSRLLGTPNQTYSPETVGDDDSLGGVARIATLATERRAAIDGPVLLVDAGDITMGSLFHLVSRETGGELELMAMLDYTAVTLGNHDFDFRPQGLADMIGAAGAVPPIVASNLVLDPNHPGDDGLEALVEQGVLVDRLIVEEEGLVVGFIGLLGKDATEVMGQAEPVTSADQVETTTRLARVLREEGADLVVVLSHSGIELQEDGTWGDEDVELLRAVPGVDVLVSGHSHTALETVVMVDGRPLVAAGANTQFLGELSLERSGDSWVVLDYELHSIDDQILGDPEVTAKVEELQEAVSERLAPARFDDLVAEVDHPLGKAEDEHELANIVTDAYRLATGADLGMTGNGTIRAELAPGPLQRSDLFLVDPLGIGSLDDSPGYALVVAWFTGDDIQDVLDFLLIAHLTKGSSYVPRISGAEIFVNPRRIPLDQIDEVVFADGSTLDDEELYGVAMTSYVATFMPLVADMTKGLLAPQMRGADGAPVDVAELYDNDPTTPDIQELKAWRALADHVATIPDLDADGLPDLPPRGVASNRFVERPSWRLLKNSSWRMKSVVGVPAALVLLLLVWRVRASLRAP
ncbi:MAG TPA: bifunctional UDP-sugar hydrolase/5'-nucleotidase [Myxococcota bacterium]|nr:bifunctional UDP-sugar hydrolase/5'-nucleotidase [Myxococcota bacterium]